jgi:hypothetical protein
MTATPKASSADSAFSPTRAGKLIAVGGTLGIVLSVAAHLSSSVHNVSGPAGALVAFIFGLIYGAISSGPTTRVALGGALTGAGSAFVGILTGFLLHDQPGMLLGAGSIGGAVAGAIAALAGRFIRSRRGAPTGVPKG